MNFKADFIDIKTTGYFSKLVTDYIDREKGLQPFYLHEVSIAGIKAAIESRKAKGVNRELLVNHLTEQYKQASPTPLVTANIEALKRETTFSICTAHQPNIFTGHLYFIYKIIHTIKLADYLNKELPANKFVPVYYMGSEDADLEELGHIFIHGKKYEWKTKQTGAVGRMIIDEAFIELLNAIEGQLSGEVYGKELFDLLRKAYIKEHTIEQATFTLVNELFGAYGLIVLLPDSSELKGEMKDIFKDDLLNQTAEKIVKAVNDKLPKEYKVQASPREINLFYLKDNIRNRITRDKNDFHVEDTNLRFSEKEIMQELAKSPERFSPNVILRPLFQEIILPNVVFIGGGGEIAYWLQTKDLFNQYKVPFPLLLLRNSFEIIDSKANQMKEKLEMGTEDIFKTEAQLIKEIVQKRSHEKLSLEDERKAIEADYNKIKETAEAVDSSLLQHTEALKVKALHQIDTLEKKILKAEKKKFDAEQRQISKLKQKLFPSGALQERVDNLLPYYAKWGDGFLKELYNASQSLEQQFCILTEDEQRNS